MSKHFKTIKQNYINSPFYKDHCSLLEEIYSRNDTLLADFTCHTTEIIASRLGIKGTEFIRSSDISLHGSKTDRLVEILKVGATHYISGPSAKDYIEKDKLADSGISLEFMSYEYTSYPQLHGSFEHNVSVLDLIFNTGPDAGTYIWGDK